MAKRITHSDPTRLIGVTGGIGSGKSEFMKRLQHLHVVTLDADAVVHQLYRPNGANHTGNQCFRELVALLGPDILATDGSIDRPKLGQKIFHDANLKAAVEAIVWPLAHQEIVHFLTAAQYNRHPLVAVESALLFMPGNEPLLSLCDYTVVVAATDATRLARVQKRSGLSAANVQLRLDNQKAMVEVALTNASFLVSNDWPVEEKYRFTFHDPLRLQALAILTIINGHRWKK